MKHWNKISLLISLLAGGVIWHRNMLGPFLGNGGADLRTFVGLLAQISATMLGFLLAALAILATIAGNRLVRNMQRTGHFKVLLRQFFFNSIAYGVATACSLLAYLAKTSLGTMGLISLVTFLYACLVLIDVGWRLWLVLTSLEPERPQKIQ